MPCSLTFTVQKVYFSHSFGQPSRMMTASHRLSILTSEEIEDIYGLPRFTDENRRFYFDLSTTGQAIVNKHTSSIAVHLILQLGYFKAKQQFFDYAIETVWDDVRYLLAHHFPHLDGTSLKKPSRPTRKVLRHNILTLFNYRLCDTTEKKEIEEKAQQLAKLSTQPIYILRELLKHLDQQRIVVHLYTFLQDMIGRVVTAERHRITHQLSQLLPPRLANQLDALLGDEDAMVTIPVLKHEPKDFSYQELRREVDRRNYFRPLYAFIQTFLVIATLSNESVKYYAALVPFYTVYKLRRMARSTAHLYLLCFSYQRFRQINNRLLTLSFMG